MYWTFDVVTDSEPDQSFYMDKTKSNYGNDLVLIVYNETVISSVLSAVAAFVLCESCLIFVFIARPTP